MHLLNRTRYAAYGSNLHPARLGRRIASAQLIGTSFSPDWSLRFHKRSVDASGKCSIRRGSSGVHFAIYDISKADRLVLDRIEGVGSGYDVISLDTRDFGRCFSYAASQAYIDEALAPYDWYRALVLAGARTLAFPGDYVKDVASITACKDPDPARHRDMWNLVDSIEAQGLHLSGECISTPAE